MTSQLPHPLKRAASSSGAGAQQHRTTQQPRLLKIGTRRSLRAILRRGTLRIFLHDLPVACFWTKFKGGWHFRFTLDGPQIDIWDVLISCQSFRFQKHPTISHHYSKVPTGIDWTSPWESGRTGAPIHGMLALQQKAPWTCWMDLMLLPRSSWKSIQQNCWFHLGRRCRFLTVSILQFNQNVSRKNARRINLPGMHWTGHHDLGLLSFLLRDLRIYGELPLPESLTAAAPCKNNQDPSLPFHQEGGRARTLAGKWLNPR